MTMRAKVPNAGSNPEVDLALAVMCAVTPPGVTWSRDAIAEVTGMSHGGPWQIEQRAIMKIRRRMVYTTHRQIGRECS